MIVLLGPHSRLRPGRRWRLAGHQRSKVVWERPPRIGRRTAATAPGDEYSLLSALTRLHEKRSRRRDTLSNTHSLRAPASSLGSFFLHTPTHDGRGRGKGLVGDEAWAGDQSSIASSWSAKSSNILPMSSKMETVVFLLERELAVVYKKRRV